MRSFKKSISIIISDILAFICYIIIKLRLLFKRDHNKGRLRILVYHSVPADFDCKDLEENNVSSTAFRQQMLILKESYKEIVCLSRGVHRLEKGELPEDLVCITFDDGFRNVFDNAVDTLENLNIPATFFLIYSYITDDGKGLGADEASQLHYMSWPMIHALKEKGFEIGSHSYSHKRLNISEDKLLETEIAYTKKKFKEKGIDAGCFAYPYGFYGDFSDTAERFVKQAGYIACVTNIMGSNCPEDDLFTLKRTRVSWRDTPFRFKMKISGAYDWVDVLKSKCLHSEKK